LNKLLCPKTGDVKGMHEVGMMVALHIRSSLSAVIPTKYMDEETTTPTDDTVVTPAETTEETPAV